MFLESNFTEQFEKTDNYCKDLLSKALVDIPPSSKAVSYASFEDLYEAEENQGLAVSAVVSPQYGPSMTVELQASATQPGVYQASFTPQETGLFSVEAISRVGDTPIEAVRSAVRYEENQEAFNIRQNRDLLTTLAQATGGQYWQAADWDELPEAISYSTAGITEQDIRYLWDAPAIFLLLVLLKATEWILRRRWRTI